MPMISFVQICEEGIPTCSKSMLDTLGVTPTPTLICDLCIFVMTVVNDIYPKKLTEGFNDWGRKCYLDLC